MKTVRILKHATENPLMQTSMVTKCLKVLPLNSPAVRVGSRQNGLFADFYFSATAFFRGFSRRICGQKCPEKSSRKIPSKILQNLYNQNPRQISAEGPGQQQLLLTSQEPPQTARSIHYSETGRIPLGPILLHYITYSNSVLTKWGFL